MSAADAGRVTHVNVVAELLPIGTRFGGASAIDKRPVPGPIAVHELGLAGDRQVNRRHHGGPDKAVYAYAREDLDWWERRLGRALAPGLFGENLTTAGMAVSDAVIGSVWRVGSDGLMLQVTMPRTPCATFERRMAEPRWVQRFAAAGRIGTYLRVLAPGAVAAGDAVEVVSCPGHAVRVDELFAADDVEPLRRRLLRDHPAGSGLAEPVRARLGWS
ncbi:MAG: MOSC domain-containing protein [Micrococcales bacterium]|nr:MOSC domain-containing protein [Micrococcales bacterium]